MRLLQLEVAQVVPRIRVVNMLMVRIRVGKVLMAKIRVVTATTAAARATVLQLVKISTGKTMS